jgi:glycosyltransferase involved in cell wall biosynthesis
MMKILWLSNTPLTGSGGRGSGTWLHALCRGLVDSSTIELGNIAMGAVSQTTRRDCGPVRQWVVPAVPGLGRDGLPSGKILNEIINTVQEFAPDLVHVWGTECFWGLLTARKLIKQAALLEIQGLKFTIAPVFDGGLSDWEQLACIGLREIIRPSSIRQGRKRFEKWVVFEKEIISKHKYIGVQSKWVEAQVKSINLECKTFHCDLILRKPFYSAKPWQFTGDFRIFCSLAYPAPFKGLHIAMRTMAILKKKFPNVNLRIAGGLSGRGIRQDGYVTWLKREIRNLGIESNVEWLGTLDEEMIIDELNSSAAILVPSYVESYCMALAEAMMLGVPSVTSFTGGTSFLAHDEVSALFFPPGDEAMCAYQLERVLTDKGLAERLSTAAREIAMKRNDQYKIVYHYLDLYLQVIGDNKGGGHDYPQMLKLP